MTNEYRSTIPQPENSTLESSDFRQASNYVFMAGALTLAASAVVAPSSFIHGMKEAKVSTNIGHLPATLGFTGNGESSLKLGIAGSFYLPVNRYGFGITAQIDGPPLTGTEGFGAYFEPTFLETYSALIDNPHDAMEGYTALLTDDARQKGVRYALPRIALLSGLGMVAYRKFSGITCVRQSKYPLAAKAVGAAAACTLLAGINTMQANYELHSWIQHEPAQDVRYPLPIFESSELAGMTTDNQDLAVLVRKAEPVARKYADRQRQQNVKFKRRAYKTLEAQKHNIVLPGKNEKAIMGQADMHSSKLMIDIQSEVVRQYNEIGGQGTIDMLLIAGDLTFGTAAEKGAVNAISKISNGAPTVAVEGNHESDVSRDQIESSGMKLLDRDIISVNNTTILGIADPQRTAFLGRSKFAKNLNETIIGEEAFYIAKDKNPDVVMLHQPAAVESFVGTSDIKSLVKSPGSDTIPTEDGIRDLPASVIVAGHWHSELPFRVAWNSDGSWTLIAVLNTAGGAIENPTVNNFSLPNATPRKLASFPVFIQNTESGLIVGYQLFRVKPDGTVKVDKFTKIGSIDGHAFKSGFGIAQNAELPK